MFNYGFLLPNTFYVKVGSDLEQYRRGAEYVFNFIVDSRGVALAAPLLFLFRETRKPWLNYLTLLLVDFSAYLVYVGGDAFPAYRFFVPLLPLIYLAFQELVRGILRRLERIRPGRHPVLFEAAHDRHAGPDRRRAGSRAVA